ncbi:hypothetical protein ACIOTI_36280 [Streptomyces sp. NPDC087843]|uniref:hypothetical protein n=1 Tax=Streptomyces sp. NPDC087843 TaxID=3365804 RepID=UPI00382CD5E3
MSRPAVRPGRAPTLLPGGYADQERLQYIGRTTGGGDGEVLDVVVRVREGAVAAAGQLGASGTDRLGQSARLGLH